MPWSRRRAASSCSATKIGQTNAFFFDAAGHQILSLDIRVEKDVADLAAHDEGQSAQFRDQGRGDERQCGADRPVASALEATRAADLAASFAGDPKKVVNMLSASPAASR